MPRIPCQTKKFRPGNPWAVANTRGDNVQERSFRFNALLHAAITVGHRRAWRELVARAGRDVASAFEITWKASALLMSIRNHEPTGGVTLSTTYSRYVPTQRFKGLDPSERRGVSYQLGLTLALAWCREQLGVPWLMHIDLYAEELDIDFRPGKSRPDLVGPNSAGSWVVVECKGRAAAPDQKAITKAKKQAKRIRTIGGIPPSLRLAFFSFFGPDPDAAGERRRHILRTLAVDPTSADGDLELQKLDLPTFFRLYYEPLFPLISGGSRSSEEDVIWRHIESLDLKIGMLPGLYRALSEEDYASVPAKIEASNARESWRQRFGYWTGDGIVIEPGDSWKRP